jgi:hypothetical protein
MNLPMLQTLVLLALTSYRTYPKSPLGLHAVTKPHQLSLIPVNERQKDVIHDLPPPLKTPLNVHNVVKKNQDVLM